MMRAFRQTSDSADWFAGLTDARAKQRIAARIVRIETGNFGNGRRRMEA